MYAGFMRLIIQLPRAREVILSIFPIPKHLPKDTSVILMNNHAGPFGHEQKLYTRIHASLGVIGQSVISNQYSNNLHELR